MFRELNLEATHKIDTNVALSKLPSVNEAAFNSFSDQSEPMCHPETRIALLSEINDWALDSQSKCIFWLNGMAGTGKSTISRTIACDFTNRRQLGASFFFKRGEGDRGNASKFFTTIAAQLVQSHPGLRPYLKKVLEMDPAISTKTMKEQFEKLIFGLLSESARPLKALIVIDALDECENEHHITIILHLLTRIQFIKSVKLRLLVTSRPELPVRLGFKQIPESHRDFILHEIPPPVIKHDIGAFLRDELPKIRETYNCLPPSGVGIPSDWPTERDMQALVNMAVPLFIFAATMCRFIGETWDWDPVGKLVKVLRYQSAGSLTQLENPYGPVLNQILQGNLTRSEKESRIQEFRNIVGSIVILFEPLSRASLAVLLGIPKITIDRRLHTLHSVLRVPKDPKSPVRLFHLSFRDFLVDSEKRETNPFWVDEADTHNKLVTRCLELLSTGDNLKEDICNLRTPERPRSDIDRQTIDSHLPPDIQYACQYWVYHLKEGGSIISDDDQVYNFLECHFLHWLESLSLIGRLRQSITMIDNLIAMIEVRYPLISSASIY
jgi:NACHT domain